MKMTFDNYFKTLQGKKIAVLGLGVSNRPLVKLLLEFGCDVVGCDRTDRDKVDAEVKNSIARLPITSAKDFRDKYEEAVKNIKKQII